jgi:hypothetical protein
MHFAGLMTIFYLWSWSKSGLGVVRAPREIRRERNVLQVGEEQVEPSQNVVHEALERLGGVAQAERHEEELKRQDGVVMAVFCISLGWSAI